VNILTLFVGPYPILGGKVKLHSGCAQDVRSIRLDDSTLVDECIDALIDSDGASCESSSEVVYSRCILARVCRISSDTALCVIDAPMLSTHRIIGARWRETEETSRTARE
jgi:hypothetical protein